MAEDDILKGLRSLRPHAEIGLADPLGGGEMPGGPSLSGLLARAVGLKQLELPLNALHDQPGALPMTQDTNVSLSHGSRTPGIKVLQPSERGPLGPGVYASDNANTFSRYGDNIYSFEVPVSSIFHGAGFHNPYYPNRSTYDIWRGALDRLRRVTEPDMRARVGETLLRRQDPGQGYELFHDLTQDYRSDTAAQNLFRRAGYKGLSGFVDGPEYLMFDPVNLYKP